MTEFDRLQSMALTGVLAVLFHQNYQTMQALGVTPDPFLSIGAVVLLAVFGFPGHLVRGVESVVKWRSSAGGEA